MAQALRARRSFVIWIFPLLLTGACSNCPPGPFQRSAYTAPYTREGLLALSRSYYLVRAEPGDTYMGLAWEHNVSPYAVISLNHVTAPYRLKPGDLVRIPTPRVHVVRRGETLSAIAKTYHVDFYDLAQANALNAPYTIYPGQVLGLPTTGPVFKSSRKNPVRASFPPPGAEDFTNGWRDPESEPEPVEEEPVEPVDLEPVESVDAEPVDPEPVEPVDPQPAEPLGMMAHPRPKPYPARAIPSAVRPRPKPHTEETIRIAAKPRPKPRSVAAQPGSASKPAGAAHELVWPVRGRIISHFGPTPNGRRNDGINISVPEGTPVHAAADGVVIYCGNEVGGFGNLVLIQHADDLVTAYGHMSEIKVEKGQRVRKGDTIALSGSTGNVEEPQLHFEVRRGVKAVDPVGHLST